MNVNLSSTKTKLEQELASCAADYDEATKELKVCLTAPFVYASDLCCILAHSFGTVL